MILGKKYFWKTSLLIIITIVINRVFSQQVHNVALMKDFYIIDTITIEESYLVTFQDTCDGPINIMILDKISLNSAINNNWTYNEAYSNCDFPTISWNAFNSLILRSDNFESFKYRIRLDLLKTELFYQTDTNYMDTRVIRARKYNKSINQFYLILLSEKVFNNMRQPPLISIKARDYILVVFPIIPEDLKR